MRAMPAEEPATLDDLMRDYVGHLPHHLRQSDARLAGSGSRAHGERVAPSGDRASDRDSYGRSDRVT